MPGHLKANLTATAEDDARKRRSGDSPAETFEARARSRAGQSRGLSNPGSDAGRSLARSVLALQRKAGNQAVARMLAGTPGPMGASLQRETEIETGDDEHLVEAGQRTHAAGHEIASPGSGAVQRSADAELLAQRTIGESLSRVKRQVGRFLKNKKLPPSTYRWDDRKPDVIAQTGFQPWKATGTLTLDEHVNNAFASGAKAGQLAKYDSQWVSTGAYGMLKKLDPVFAQKVMNTHLYRIDTAIAGQSDKFHDANAHFDKIGKNRPYASQREWTKEGGIAPQAVVNYMDGMDFINQYDMTTGAPDEAQLTNWKAMPATT